MTTKYLTGTYRYGYTDSHAFTSLSVTSTGTVAGIGLQSVYGSLSNSGLIQDLGKSSALGLGGRLDN